MQALTLCITLLKERPVETELLFPKLIFMLVLMKVCGRMEEGVFWPLVSAEEYKFLGHHILRAGPVSGDLWVLSP